MFPTDVAGRTLDAYGALFLARRRAVGALVLAATLLDPAAGACGLAAGGAALATRAVLRLPALAGETEVLNAIYAALAVGAFHAFDHRLLALVVFGGMLAVPLGTALQRALAGPQGSRGLPLLGAPFLCTAWTLLAAAKALAIPLRWSYPAWPQFIPLEISTQLANVGALFYVANPLSGLLVLAALLLASRALALLALGGSLLAHLLTLAMGTPAGSSLPILAAFNGALVAIFLGGALAEPSRRALLVAAGGVVVSTMLSAALLALFWNLGLPPLSAPFLLTVWLAKGALRLETSAWWARHWLTVPAAPEDGLLDLRLAKARGVDPASISLALPFAGRMEVSQGVDGPHTHQGPWRYAVDFIRTEEGRSFAGAGETVEDFYCFGQPVLSPAWGQVVACRNDVPDNRPGETNLLENWGNYVLIALASGDCVLLAHLRQGSLLVVPGQSLAPGTTIGQCGNSGRSTQPHLHLHVQRGAWLGAPTRPFHLSGYLAGRQFILDDLPAPGTVVQTAAPDPAFATGFALAAGREWTFFEGDTPWSLAVLIGLLGEIRLATPAGAHINAVAGPGLFALHRRSGPEDRRLDAFALAFGLTPQVVGAGLWRDAPGAGLLPLNPWLKLRLVLRNPFGASLESRYSRRWDAARNLWIQEGEHSLPILGGRITARTTGWIEENCGPVRFRLEMGDHAVVDLRLARIGNRGDHGVPAWSADYTACTTP